MKKKWKKPSIFLMTKDSVAEYIRVAAWSGNTGGNALSFRPVFK